MILSTPDAHRLLKLKPINNMTDMVISPAPVSPSKRARTQSQSHYSAAAQASLEASPSKRRVKPLPDSGVEFSESEKRILFGKITMNRAGVDNDEAEEEEEEVLNMGDLSMQSPPKLKPSLRSKIRAAVKPIAKSRAGARRAARIQSTAVDADVFAA